MDEDNIFKILIATDNHIGYLEGTNRGEDSFESFEEILKLAHHHDVDFILLGGDLFHDNNPSRSALHRVMKLLRQYCMGDRPVKFTVCSDQSINFCDEFNTANFLDPNFNVGYPVFSIHGNHDDPSGRGGLCALDLLSVSGLVNYFGRIMDVDNIKIYPLLLQKGTTKLALYGLGNIRDERLHRAWRDGHVSFVRPVDDGEDGWRNGAFNMFVLHQNRVRHGQTSHIPEEFINDFFDLVVWGHEHECRIMPEPCHGIHVTQPGSSVATSLAEGEAVRKHVGLLTVCGQDYRLEKIPLTTVRPFKFTSVALSMVPQLSPGDPKGCERYLASVATDLIQQAKEEWEANRGTTELVDSQAEERPMPLPLIRIKVDYSGGFETFNNHLFGLKFAKQVANPKDIIRFYRSQAVRTRPSQTASRPARDPVQSIPERLDSIRIEDLTKEFVGHEFSIIPENEIIDTVQLFVEKDDTTAIPAFLEKTLNNAKRTMESLRERGHDQDLSDEYVKRRTLATKQQRYEDYARERSGRFSAQ